MQEYSDMFNMSKVLFIKQVLLRDKTYQSTIKHSCSMPKIHWTISIFNTS